MDTTGSEESISRAPEYVAGLRKDWDAVRAAFREEWSNRMVEAQVNRFKLIKRIVS